LGFIGRDVSRPYKKFASQTRVVVGTAYWLSGISELLKWFLM